MQKQPSKNPVVYKSNELNQGGFGSFSHSDYQIFLLLISQIGGKDEKGKFLPPEKLQREHTLKASDLGKMFSVNQKNTYKTLKTSCKKLMGRTLTIETPKVTTLINVCSKAEYNEGEGSIKIKFTDDIMPYLAQVKERFMLYNLKEVSNFNSLYTTRLYELLQEFKYTGWMIKSVEQLRKSFAATNKFSRYGNFKQRTFSSACEEINKHYNLNLTYEEIKEGKKVTAIKFTFNKIDYVESIDPDTERKKRHYTSPQKIQLKTPQNPEVKKLPNPRKTQKRPPLLNREKKTKKKVGFFTSLFEKFKKRKTK